MIISVAGFKGGVGKTTTAFHFAAYLQAIAPTVLVDGDPNRSALTWARQAESLAFKVISEQQIAKYAGNFTHIVLDTKARPDRDDLADLIDTSDVLILPTPPAFLDLTALIETIKTLQELGCQHHKVLLTKVPTTAGSTDEQDARELLAQFNIPVFKGRIRFYKVFEKASLAGLAVNQVKGDSKARIAWNDYEAVIKEAIDGKI